MAEVIVQAKIEAVIASNRVHKVVRDPAGEKLRYHCCNMLGCYRYKLTRC